jgi:hypothetical protein
MWFKTDDVLAALVMEGSLKEVKIYLHTYVKEAVDKLIDSGELDSLALDDEGDRERLRRIMKRGIK